MPDYAGNSKREKEVVKLPQKNIERVVVSEVIVKKRGIGRKFRDLFIEADFKTVARYVAADVLLPAARNMFVDAVTRGSERMVYGESAIRRRGIGGRPHMTYNNPINRGGFGGSPISSRESTVRYAPPTSPEPRVNTPRLSNTDLILTSREEGELVLENMNAIIEQFDVASVADMHDLVGLPHTHVDNKWGWSNLSGSKVLQVREGYLIDLPPAEPIA